VTILAPQKGAAVFEQGDRTYLIAPLTPVTPTVNEIEEYAFGKSLIDQAKRQAPNPNIAWFGGHYIEADTPNENGAMWRANEIAIKRLTPMYMPVTVMHDFRSAVGVIANIALKTPDDDGVQRSKIETVLALWKHRFPEVVAEAEANHEAGTLMQSMECISPDYECSECGAVFHKLPQGAEQEHWCDHLQASNPSAGYSDLAGVTPNASRILRNVVFTGTGLIFGTRGSHGADASAYLESFQDEVAAFHQRVHGDTETARSTIQMAQIQVEESEYTRIKSERDDFKTRAETAEREKAEAVSAAETAEAAKVKAEGELAEATKKVENFEESARKGTLADERLGALGDGFTEKIDAMPTLKKNLHEQAKSLSDEEWAARLSEVEEVAKVKRDAKKDGSTPPSGDPDASGSEDESAANKDTLFEREEVASSQVSGGGNGDSGGNANGQQTPAARRSVVAGLVKPRTSK
jgi:hypothetical protein